MKNRILAPVLMPAILVLCVGSALGQTAAEFANQAVAAFKANNPKEAERLFGECIRVAPRDVECIYKRGLVREIAIGYGLALQDYTLALSIQPNNVEILAARGQLYDSLKRPDEGIADLTRAIQLKPDHARAYYHRANLYRDKGEIDKAIADYGQSARYNPSDELSYSFRASLYEKKGLEDLAVGDYARAIAAKPAKGSNYLQRGEIYFYQGKADLAEADFKRALELDPTLKWQVDYMRSMNPLQKINSLGAKQAMREQWDAAIVSYTKAIELAPNDHWGYVNRGRAHQGKRDFAKAMADFNTAIGKLPPASASGFIAERAAVYLEQGNYALAMTDLNTAIAGNKDGQPNQWNLLLRGKIYARQGKTALARADFEKAMQMDQYIRPKAQAELTKLPAN